MLVFVEHFSCYFKKHDFTDVSSYKKRQKNDRLKNSDIFAVSKKQYNFWTKFDDYDHCENDSTQRQL